MHSDVVNIANWESVMNQSLDMGAPLEIQSTFAKSCTKPNKMDGVFLKEEHVNC